MLKICADLPDFLVTALSAEVTTLADTQRRFLEVREWMGMSRAAPSDLGLHARLQANEAEAKAAWQRLIDARLANASAEDAAGEDATAGGAGGGEAKEIRQRTIAELINASDISGEGSESSGGVERSLSRHQQLLQPRT